MSECKSSLRTLTERFQGMKKSINPKVMNMIDSVEKKEASLKNMMKTVIRDKRKIEETITSLDEYKKKALHKTWTKVNADFGQIFADLLPGSFAKLDPPEGKQISDGLEVKVSLGKVWKQSLTELSGGQRYVYLPFWLLSFPFSLSFLPPHFFEEEESHNIERGSTSTPLPCFHNISLNLYLQNHHRHLPSTLSLSLSLSHTHTHIHILFTQLKLANRITIILPPLYISWFSSFFKTKRGEQKQKLMRITKKKKKQVPDSPLPNPRIAPILPRAHVHPRRRRRGSRPLAHAKHRAPDQIAVQELPVHRGESQGRHVSECE